jgi:hypothetical protein
MYWLVCLLGASAFVVALGAAIGAAAFGRPRMLLISCGLALAELAAALFYLVGAEMGGHGSESEAVTVWLFLFLLGGVPAAIAAGVIVALIAVLRPHFRRDEEEDRGGGR